MTEKKPSVSDLKRPNHFDRRKPLTDFQLKKESLFYEGPFKTFVFTEIY